MDIVKGINESKLFDVFTFNGFKKVIATVCFLLAQVAPAVGYGEMAPILIQLGTIFGAAGLTHDAFKAGGIGLRAKDVQTGGQGGFSKIGIMWILIVMSLVAMSGCGKTSGVFTQWNPPAVCMDSPDSLLMQIPEPKLVSMGLVYANVKLAQKYGYGPEVIDAIEDVEDKLTDGITGHDFIMLLAERVDKLNTQYTLELMVLADVVNLDVPLPLNTCDVELIKIHLKRQKDMLKLFSK